MSYCSVYFVYNQACKSSVLLKETVHQYKRSKAVWRSCQSLYTIKETAQTMSNCVSAVCVCVCVCVDAHVEILCVVSDVKRGCCLPNPSAADRPSLRFHQLAASLSVVDCRVTFDPPPSPSH